MLFEKIVLNFKEIKIEYKSYQEIRIICTTFTLNGLKSYK